MSDVVYIEGIDGRNGKFEPSPVNYFPNNPDMVATRLTIFNYEDPVFYHDFIIHEGTLYALYLEAMPDYRDGKWTQYIDFKGGSGFQQAMEIYGRHEREVIMNISEHSAPSVMQGIRNRIDLTEKDIMFATKLFLTGSVMEVIDTGNPPADIA